MTVILTKDIYNPLLILDLLTLQMNVSLFEYDNDGRYLDSSRGLDDSRLLDAAETLVTLQTSDLGSGSNNPLFGSTIGHPALQGIQEN